ncbi:tRNA lysidine(34) synthetase TilS [Candidatus Aminicenantes bacterium AC-334-K16]|jgi:tRNA(Ile)-lysidine synthase|nr:tRNA lysidine(34) synthetase TilS [Candidatus Aminicenantes bacterium AC-334-K16]
MTLLEKTRKTIIKYNLIQRGDKILLAFSGGVDSSALLHLLLSLQEEWRFVLYLAHFNHKLRPEANEEEAFVRQRAEQLQLPLFVQQVDVRQKASRQRANLEETARFWRYKFLEEKALEIGGAKIATGHNLNDQIETFFLRLFRGTGPLGLGGMKPVMADRFIRPLIEISRREIEAYLRENKIPYRVDKSNFDRKFLRNKIRADLIPYLEKEFDPALLRHINTLMSILREEEEILNELAKSRAEELITEEEGMLQLDRPALLALSPALGRRVVREYLRRIKGDLRGFTFRDVEAVLEALPGSIICLSRHIKLRCEKERIYLPFSTESPSFYYEWDGQEKLVIPEVGFIFEGSIQEKSCLKALVFDDWGGAYFDRQKISFPLIVKPRQEGDKYQPLGAPGRKKLKELFRERRIPLFLRSRLPVFWSGGEIIWIPGLPVAEKARIGQHTREIFQIKVIKGSFLSRFERQEDSIIDG